MMLYTRPGRCGAIDRQTKGIYAELILSFISFKHLFPFILCIFLLGTYSFIHFVISSSLSGYAHTKGSTAI